MKVLFLSDRPLGRAENIRAVYDLYDGRKDFSIGSMKHRDISKYDVLVTDEIPSGVDEKGKCRIIFIGHGLTGGKSYGADSSKFWERGASLIDFAICSSKSKWAIETMSRQLGIPKDRVLPLGMPRTDSYFKESRPAKKGDGKTFLKDFKRAYLYCPTFRGPNDPPMPELRWKLINMLLQEDEILVVKRHMLTEFPIVWRRYDRIVEVDSGIPSREYLIDCDVLATDFSSILFDGYVLNKPSVLVTDSYRDYLKSRGMYLEYPNEYGSVTVNAEGELRAFVDSLRIAYGRGMGFVEERCKNMVSNACDGNSAQRVVELIESLGS